jgi:two-component system, sensor histidine kinase YesM
MKMVMDGNLNVQTDISLTKDSTDEVKELNYVFNQMTGQLSNLLEEVYHEGVREKEAELRALKAQINPHFLYNTLDTVYWMLIDKSDYDIADIVTKLGEILRYSIKKGSTNVKVREEIQQIENYLFIQKARFEDNLDYQVNIDSEILDYEILSFVIQPFVENSINHGLMHDKGCGKVIINGFRENEKIVFEILDDGSGMTKEQISKLYEKKADKNSGHGGIGVLNVHERIRYYYGEEYGVKIESQKGEGTRVKVEIPVKKSGEVVYEA